MCWRGGMADAKVLGAFVLRRGGSSPLASTKIVYLTVLWGGFFIEKEPVFIASLRRIAMKTGSLHECKGRV